MGSKLSVVHCESLSLSCRSFWMIASIWSRSFLSAVFVGVYWAYPLAKISIGSRRYSIYLTVLAGVPRVGGDEPRLEGSEEHDG